MDAWKTVTEHLIKSRGVKSIKKINKKLVIDKVTLKSLQRRTTRMIKG